MSEEDKIKIYADKIPSELSRAMGALCDENGRAIFLVLFKYGELTISQIMEELQVNAGCSSWLFESIKNLQKASLVKSDLVDGEKILYDVTEFGEYFIKGLMSGIK